METFPPLSEDLLAELDKLHKPITPADVMKLTDQELAYKAGKRQVVEHLQMVLARSKEEDHVI